ncbi:MAG TPA: ABC transporter permease, partial [Gemmatimonadales bacterium]|nr:ABC transporter permease [Gemmatimonadales bacterium]
MLRRLAESAVTFALALTIVFFLMRVAPGDPLARVFEARALSGAEVAALRSRYGLDQPLTTQFQSFVGGLVGGDLGVSIEYGRPVTSLLAERLPPTLLLGSSVLLLNFSFGLWLGVRQAVRRGRREDRWLTTL